MMCRSIGENLKKVILFFSNYLPLQIWTLKICNHDISKTITARSFKLGQLIADLGPITLKSNRLQLTITFNFMIND